MESPDRKAATTWTEERELHLLQRAIALNRWRWRAEVRRLRRRGEATPFRVHLCELQLLHTVWRELRREHGCPAVPPMAVRRIMLRLADRKCRAFLDANPS